MLEKKELSFFALFFEFKKATPGVGELDCDYAFRFEKKQRPVLEIETDYA